MSATTAAALDDTSPTICIFTDHLPWDHWLLFAMTEINSGMYSSTLGDLTFQHRFLFSDPYAVMPEGEAQAVFSAHYESCHVFVNPGWTSQLSAIGEWAGIVHKPIISGGATSPIFAQENFGYVSRSVPSSLYSIEAYVELINEYGFSLINLVHMNDEWGSSVARELVSYAGDGFQIQVLRSFESPDDVDGIQSALDDIQASPTRVTFVCTTEIHTGVFLNAAGKRGMHETQLWLAPKAAGNSIVFDPPSSGGIWAITDGEEMTEDNPLGQRYLAKDLTPHIEAQEKYGFNNVTDELTYWGAYYYDAVLAAAHALAAAKNRSDGEEVLKEIHNLSLDNANTGVLEMDENGERRGARNPVFYITPEGEKVQFALYDGNLDILQDPLWPGGSTIQPKLIMENTSAKRVGSIVGGVLGGLVIILGIAFALHFKRSKEELNEQRTTLRHTVSTLRKCETELKELQNTIKESVGTTKYGDAVEFVTGLLEDDSLKDKRDQLKLVKSCLIKGNDASMHIPQNLNADEEEFILKEYAGVNLTSIKASFGTRHPQSVRNGASTRNFNVIKRQSSEEASIAQAGCIPEFTQLDCAQQKKLFELLSFSSLQKWDFNIFDVAAIDEENTLLFVAWAVICSPYSQISMAKELRRAGVEVTDEIQGYEFTDIDFLIDGTKLINYIRLIQDGYLDTPYHNRIHAADVVQTLNSLLQMAIEKFPFDKEDLFLILVSAVVHDVKHPGRNNAFQVNSFSELALNWNDISVLESEHVSFAFKCMIQEEDSHFIQNADPSKLHNVRKKMIDAVLHTDMTKHFAGVSKIKAAAAGKSWDQLEPNVRWEVLMYMLHMADISNPAKGDPMFKIWTDRCLEEFFQQGDKEKEMGVPISPNCDRNTTKRPDSQVGFIKFVVRPAYEVLGEIIPGVNQHVLPVIESNLVYWDGEKKLDETV